VTGKRDEWHKAFHDRDLVDCFALSAEARGVLWTLRNMIMRSRGRIHADMKALSKQCRMRVDRFGVITDDLIMRRLIYLEAGYFRSATTDELTADREDRRAHFSTMGKTSAARRAGAQDPAGEPVPEPDLFTNQGDRVNARSDPGQIPGSPAEVGTKSRGSAEQVDLNPRSSRVVGQKSERKQRSAVNDSESEEEGRRRKRRLPVVPHDVEDLTAGAVDEAVAIYNAQAGAGNNWPKCATVTPKRRRALGRLLNLRHVGGIDGWRATIDRASKSSWLSGKTKRGNGHENWRASLDYFSREDVFVEISEGRHDDQRSSDIAGEGNKTSAVGKAIAAVRAFGTD
jgi:hypothetical protein